MSADSANNVRKKMDANAGFRFFLAASLIAHLIALASVAVSGCIHGKPKWQYSVVSVRTFAAPPGAKTGPPKTAPSKPAKTFKPAEKKPKPAEVKKPDPPKPEAKKVISDNTAKKKPEEPKKKPEAPKKEPAAEKPKEAPKEVPKEEPKPDTPPEDMDDISRLLDDAPDFSSPGDAGEGDAGVGGFAGELDPRLRIYYGDLSQRMWEAWRLPPTVPYDAGLEVIVLFVIDYQGRLLHFEIQKESGNFDMDQSVKDLLADLEDKTFPALPFRPEQDSVKFKLRFTPSPQGP